LFFEAGTELFQNTKAFHTCLLRALAIDRAMLVFPTPENMENNKRFVPSWPTTARPTRRGIHRNEEKVLPRKFFQRTFLVSLSLVKNSTEHTHERKENCTEFLIHIAVVQSK